MFRSKKYSRDRKVTREIHRLFWRAFLQDKRSLIIAYAFRIPGFLIIYSLIPLVSAYTIQAILRKDIVQVDHYALLIVLLGVLYTMFTYVGESAIIKNAMISSEYIQRRIFQNYLQKDYDFYTNTYFGALGAKATGIRDASNAYGEIITLVAPRQLTIIVSGVAIIAWHSALLAIVTVIAMGAVLGFTISVGAYRVRFRRQVSEASSQLAGTIGDALSHGSTVKSFAMEDAELVRLNKSLKPWSTAQRRQWRTFIPADMGRMMLASIATAVLLVTSAHLYIHGGISIAIVVLLQLYVIRLIASTVDIAQMIKTYEQVMSAAYAPVETMLVQTVVTDRPAAKKLSMKSRYTLAISDVSYRYDEAGTNQYAIKDFSLTIKPGEKIGLVGYSGSGKTTLTKLLLRFMDVKDGSISLDSLDIGDVRQADLRSVISYVPQEPLLFHRSIGENIAYAKPEASNEDIARVAKLAYVNEFVQDLPQGYETLVGERGVKLSGGQRQRVAIARALLKDSPILVLDEATSALDSESEKYIQEALWHLMKDRTAIVIAHRLSTIQRMDRIVVMHRGKIVQVGTHKELLKDKTGIYAKLWNHQSGGYLAAKESDT